MDPQPNTSFAVASVWRQPATQLHVSHSGKLWLPSAQRPHPVPLWRTAKKSAAPSGAEPSQPVGESCATSAALLQTCHPGAQRSHAEQPSPLGLAPSSPPPKLHVGVRPPSNPGTWNPPLHPAIHGYLARSTKPSRWPSAHPDRLAVVVVDVVVMVVVDVVVMVVVDVVVMEVDVDEVEPVVLVEAPPP